MTDHSHRYAVLAHDVRNALRQIVERIPLFAAASAFVLVAGAALAAPTYDEILAGARKEGHLSIWISTPNQENTHSALLEAFNKKFGLDTKWEWVSLHPAQSVTRVITEASAGKLNVDVLGAGSTDQMGKLAQKGLLKPYPWTEVFGGAMPKISEPYERVMATYRGLGLLWFDNVYGIAWNTKLAKADDIPTTVEQFADPKWKGRFAFNSQSGVPLDLMALVIGEDKATDLAKRILANRPVLSNGTPMLSSSITAGQAKVGVSSFFNTDRAKKNGEPQDFRFFTDYVPINSLNVYVPEGSPNPNTARLFAAWLATEGVHIAEKFESLGRLSDPDSAVAKAYAAQAHKGQIIEPKTDEEVVRTRELSDKLTLLFTGRPQ